jgi:uncharacterized protein (DUF1697 family)
MAKDLSTLVIFLRGVNVGGHRRFRPSQVAEQLKHLGCVNIGAAGTFVIKKPVPLKQLRAELAKLLPFETTAAICHGSNITQLIADQPFGPRKPAADVVRFLSVMPNKTSRVKPLKLPATGKWLVRVIGQRDRFLLGEYRRNMKTIGYLGKLDKVVGTPVTTRNWNTVAAIARAVTQTPSTR